PAGDLLPHTVPGDQRVARLVDIAELDGVADPKAPAIGLLLAGDHAEERRLAGAIGADDADDTAGRQPEAQFLDQEIITEPLPDPIGLDDEVAEPRSGRQDDLCGLGRLLAAL